MGESRQKTLLRVRPPRVKITYDVETLGAIEMKELPYVMGVMAPLSGDTPDPLPLKQRVFQEVDRDNFGAFLASLQPSVLGSVENKLPPAISYDGSVEEVGKTLGLSLHFRDLEDFTPDAVVKQIPRLGEWFQKRDHLRELLVKLDGNDHLVAQIEGLLGTEEGPRMFLSDTLKAVLPPPAEA